MSQHRGQLQADIIRLAGRSLVQSKEVVREAQLVVDLDQQVRQPDGRHLAGQPAFQAMQLGFGVRGQALGGVHRKAPAPISINKYLFKFFIFNINLSLTFSLKQFAAVEASKLDQLVVNCHIPDQKSPEKG